MILSDVRGQRFCGGEKFKITKNFLDETEKRHQLTPEEADALSEPSKHMTLSRDNFRKVKNADRVLHGYQDKGYYVNSLICYGPAGPFLAAILLDLYD